MSVLLRNRTVKKEIDLKYRELCDFAAWRIRWDYIGYKKAGNFNTFYSQHDWNQTLITKINQLSAQIHKATLRGGGNVIVTSPQLICIFESLEYYDVSNKTLGNRYNVIVDHGIHPMDVLVYYDAPEHIKNIRIDGIGEVENNRYYGVVRVDGFDNCDAERELSSMLSKHISNEIDKEIINGLRASIKPNRRLLLLKKVW